MKVGGNDVGVGASALGALPSEAMADSAELLLSWLKEGIGDGPSSVAQAAINTSRKRAKIITFLISISRSQSWTTWRFRFGITAFAPCQLGAF